MCVFQKEAGETNEQKYMVGYKLNLISQDIKLAFISFCECVCVCVIWSHRPWNMLHLGSIGNQIINNNYMFPSALPIASFGLRLYTSANKPEEQSLCSSPIENKYILFYPLNISLNWPRKFVKKQAEDEGGRQTQLFWYAMQTV